MSQVIDLRSDTLTKPNADMRRAMAQAEVGDDVFGEDPTVNALQAEASELLGKEAAIFVPSGTMANQLAIRAQTHHGDEIIADRNCHTFNYEAGAVAALSGVLVRTIEGNRGILKAQQIKEAIRPKDQHFAPTRLICLENTHNRGGGSVYPLEEIVRIRELAEEQGLLMHLDGIVVGSHDLIEKVHRYRKMFGGGMRQVGILAAAGIYALEHNVSRLAEDHQNAKTLARAIQNMKGATINADEVETNIVIFDVQTSGMSAHAVTDHMKRRGVLMLPTSQTRIRAVTHLDVSRADIDEAIERIDPVLS